MRKRSLPTVLFLTTFMTALFPAGKLDAPWSASGLFDENGKKHELPRAIEVTGRTLNVIDFGAVPGDRNFDNKESFHKALEEARPGDEVFVPAGDWYFLTSSFSTKSYSTHIKLKSGVNFRGEDRESVRLISRFEPYMNENRNTTVLLAASQSEITVSGLTITSDTPDSFLPDPDRANLTSRVPTAPVYALVVDNEKPVERHGRIIIRDVAAEKFHRTGIRIRSVHDVLVENCLIRKALDLGTGGAGYGIAVQGMGPGADMTGTNLDTVHNVVKNCDLQGPYLRHGILLQYSAHHNLIEGNRVSRTLLDGIDLHGEDEYANMIRDNTIEGTRQGAAIGVGNSGATHDAAGPANVIQDNVILGGSRGIEILYGSPDTLITGNTIKDLTGDKAWGILVRNGPGTVIKDNEFSNIGGADTHGVKILYSYNALEPEKGLPLDVRIDGNRFDSVQNGIYVETSPAGELAGKNRFGGRYETEMTDGADTFILPPVSDVVIPRKGTRLLPTDDNFITYEAPDSAQSQNNMKFKASYSEPPYNRMIYMRFDVSEAPAASRVYLKFSAKSKDGLASINIWGTQEYTDWNEKEITWNNAPYHDSQTAFVVPAGDLKLAGTFAFPSSGNDFNTYFVDITDYIEGLSSPRFTLIFANDDVQGMYCEVYSKEIGTDEFRPGLIFSRGGS